MRFRFAFNFRHPLVFSILVVGALSLMPNSVAAQSRDDEHVVSPADLRNEIQSKAQTRKDLEGKLEKFFSSERGKQALKSAHLDPQLVRAGVRELDDEELARLAARAEKAQSDFAAGALTNQEITYVLIALATAVIIIVIVVA